MVLSSESSPVLPGDPREGERLPGRLPGETASIPRLDRDLDNTSKNRTQILHFRNSLYDPSHGEITSIPYCSLKLQFFLSFHQIHIVVRLLRGF